MRKLLLLGAFGVGSFFTAHAQNSCAEAVTLPFGTTTVGTINGTYLTSANGGCWNPPAAPATDATGAEWYTFTADTDMLVRINTNLPVNVAPNSVDTRVSVYTGTCGALQCFNGSDDVNPAATGGNYLTDFTFFVTEGTTYYVAFDNRWSSAPFSVEFSNIPPDCSSTIPYTETWDIKQNFLCWETFNIDGDGIAWQYNDVNDFTGDGVDDAILALPSTATGNAAKDDWAISKGLDLTAGTEYTITIKYFGLNNGAGQTANEDLELLMLNEQDPEATGQISVATINDIVQPTIPAGTTNLESLATTQSFTYTPLATATHYLGLHATSEAASGWLIVYDIIVTAVLSTNDVLSSQFSVFPNPSTNVINIANAENILVNGIEIVDINGRTVKSVKFDNVSEAQINISDLASGMYLVNISSDKGTTTKKIVKN
jgi:hypothetical protein